jgi:hypothetical protein
VLQAEANVGIGALVPDQDVDGRTFEAALQADARSRAAIAIVDNAIINCCILLMQGGPILLAPGIFFATNRACEA